MSYQVGDGTNAILLSDSSGGQIFAGNVYAGTVNGFDSLGIARGANRVYDDLVLNRTALPDVIDPTSWITDSTLAPHLRQTATIAIGDYAYLFGGYDDSSAVATNKIYRAPLNSMSDWTDTGATLPAADYGYTPIVNGDHLYLFAGANNFAYRATVSNPLSWELFVNGSAYNVTVGQPFGTLITSGNYLYKIGGYNSQAIHSAPLSSDLSSSSWSGTGGFGGGLNWGQALMVVGDYLWMFGGATSNGNPYPGIYRAPMSDINSGLTLMGALPGGDAYVCPSVATVGEYAYLLGSYLGRIYRAPLSDLTAWVEVSTMPASYQSKILAIGDKLYSFAGVNSFSQHCKTSAWTGRDYFQLNYGNGPRLYDSTGTLSVWDSSGNSYTDVTMRDATFTGNIHVDGTAVIGLGSTVIDATSVSTGSLRIIQDSTSTGNLTVGEVGGRTDVRIDLISKPPYPGPTNGKGHPNINLYVGGTPEDPGSGFEGVLNMSAYGKGFDASTIFGMSPVTSGSIIHTSYNPSPNSFPYLNPVGLFIGCSTPNDTHNVYGNIYLGSNTARPPEMTIGGGYNPYPCVGIGNTTPGYTLDMSGTGSGLPSLNMTGDSPSVIINAPTSAGFIDFEFNTDGGGFDFWSYGSANGQTRFGGVNVDGGNGYDFFGGNFFADNFSGFYLGTDANNPAELAISGTRRIDMTANVHVDGSLHGSDATLVSLHATDTVTMIAPDPYISLQATNTVSIAASNSNPYDYAWFNLGGGNSSLEVAAHGDSYDATAFINVGFGGTNKIQSTTGNMLIMGSGPAGKIYMGADPTIPAAMTMHGNNVDMTANVHIDGALNNYIDVDNRTSDSSLTAGESGAMFTNAGSSIAINYALPTGPVGVNYNFAVMTDSSNLKVTAQPGMVIRSGSSVSYAGGFIDSSAIGSTLQIVLMDASTWLQTSMSGTWTLSLT